MPESDIQNAFRIGQLHFDLISRQLSSEQQSLYLEPQAFQLLCFFLKAEQGQLSRDQLIAQLWQGRVVSESAINKAVSLLRKAFAQLDAENTYIETLPKLGYRLCQPIQPQQNTQTLQDIALSVSTEPVKAPSPTPQAAETATSLKTKLILTTLWTAPLLFLAWWFFITQAPQQTQQRSPYSTAPVPISHAQGVEYDLTLSQDGKQLLYFSTQQQQTQLLLQQGTGSPQILSSEAEIKTAALSPDGTAVLWVWQNKEKCQVQWFLVADATAKKTVAPCHTDSSVKLGWQNDSKGFYFRDRKDKTQPYFLVHYRLDTAAQQQITAPLAAESPTGALAFAESDDGKQLAILGYLENQQRSVLLLDTQSFQPIQKKTIALAGTTIDWLADQLLISVGAELFRYHPTTEQIEPLFYTGRDIQSLAVAQQQIYYADYELDADIWQHELTASGKARLRIGSSKIDRMPRVNQQGDLAFLTQRLGKDQIWLQPKDQNEYLLADLPGTPSFVRLGWAPDGKALLFCKDSALWQVSVASGQPVLLLGPEHQVEVANWAEDGKSIIYSSKKSGDWQLWQLDVTTSDSRQLTKDGGYSGYLHQGQLYFSKFHQDGLFQLNLQTNQQQQLLADFDKINWLNWKLDAESGAIYFYQPGQGILSYTLSSKQQILLLPMPERFVHHYDIQNQLLFYVKAGLPKGDLYKLQAAQSTTD